MSNKFKIGDRVQLLGPKQGVPKGSWEEPYEAFLQLGNQVGFFYVGDKGSGFVRISTSPVAHMGGNFFFPTEVAPWVEEKKEEPMKPVTIKVTDYKNMDVLNLFATKIPRANFRVWRKDAFLCLTHHLHKGLPAEDLSSGIDSVEFILPKQWEEAMEYVKKYHDEFVPPAPPKPTTKIFQVTGDLEVTFHKDKIVYGAANIKIKIEQIEALIASLRNLPTVGVWETKSFSDIVYIGCQKVHLKDLENAVSAYRAFQKD